MSEIRMRRLSTLSAQASQQPGEDSRPEYANPIELLLTLIGYAVGLGNIWRFPYLVFEYGGGTFLIPYFICLMLLGLPLFILEMGVGQMYRQGTLGIWQKIGLPRFRGAGVAATTCTYIVSLYYNVILAWTIYYLGATIFAIPSGHLPWSEVGVGGCSEVEYLISRSFENRTGELINEHGRFNQNHRDQFACPENSAQRELLLNTTHTLVKRTPSECPAAAAAIYWKEFALQQSDSMANLGGFHPGMLVSLTIAWVLVYLIIYKGVESSGKVVYVTATLPYVALVAFFFRAMTLEGMSKGLAYYLKPDPLYLFKFITWQKAATQIFYSLGVGFGSLIAFASYSSKSTDFAKQSTQVAFINCGTSVFAGFVVFPILGFLANELSSVNPCIMADDIHGLSKVGLSGTGLAFIAFPIAISKMFGGFVWALLFFIMLFCLGVDSQFAMVEGVMTVLHDAGVGHSLPKWQLTALVCGVSWLLGLIFVTRAGVYWFNLFDYYSCVIAMFVVTFVECLGVSICCNKPFWGDFTGKVKEWTGRELGPCWLIMYTFVCPVLILILTLSSLGFTNIGTGKFLKGLDMMNALEDPSLPSWSIALGWILGILPIAAALPFAFIGGDEEQARSLATSREDMELSTAT
eukprot:CAMPEP_0117503806 /NCGR_PEP_ID=MMETSP0784-20121206/24524_1 /TAXON_ID=39447 /ORGANISM="" /LENGTH=633 /DNA_ID=CAMNT_0005299143 /DNA_START=63 /DNA_END=1964 /DNA_ORIENTATION=+